MFIHVKVFSCVTFLSGDDRYWKMGSTILKNYYIHANNSSMDAAIIIRIVLMEVEQNWDIQFNNTMGS